MSLPRAFASDNTAPVHPAVLNAISSANVGPAKAYGDDAWTGRATEWFKGQFGDDVAAWLVWNGTGANVTALRAVTRPFNGIICTAQSHINVDECGAPELFTGCKLIDITTPDAKLTPALIEAAWRGVGNEHAVQPGVVSLTQTTEYGTAYTLEELGAVCDAAHRMKMLVHVDGSRIANAAASLDCSLRACTRDVGVDVLSFGATKNGAMGAEAVVVFNPAIAGEMKYFRKQSAQLASKMRYLAVQFLALGEDELWLRNARHANAMARRLADGVRGVAGVTITQPVQGNAVFAVLPPDVTERLQREFHFYVWDDRTGEVRWMCNWATAPEDVDELIAAVRKS